MAKETARYHKVKKGYAFLDKVAGKLSLGRPYSEREAELDVFDG